MLPKADKTRALGSGTDNEAPPAPPAVTANIETGAPPAAPDDESAIGEPNLPAGSMVSEALSEINSCDSANDSATGSPRAEPSAPPRAEPSEWPAASEGEIVTM